MYNRGSIMSEDERKEIYNWAISMRPKMNFLSNNRRNYTLIDSDTEIHPLVHTIRKRIEEKEGLTPYSREEKIKDFMAIISPGGYIYKHTDPNNYDKKLLHIRFNVFISTPKEGGKTYYAGQEVETKEKCYVLCRSGIDEHWTEPSDDDNYRISFSFGYLLPPKKVDELCDPKFGTYKHMYPVTSYVGDV
jgi:hypothetical protein